MDPEKTCTLRRARALAHVLQVAETPCPACGTGPSSSACPTCGGYGVLFERDEDPVTADQLVKADGG